MTAFFAMVTKLSSCNKDYKARKAENICTLTEKLLTLILNRLACLSSRKYSLFYNYTLTSDVSK